jgi:hypothetical protein
MNIDFKSALKNAATNKTGRKFPDREDERCKAAVLFPEFKPSFKIESGASIFTIGSCFARNIEEVLEPLNFKLPTMAFSVPKSEWRARPNGLLNEYNPGTISQRILHALEGKQTPEETIVASGDLYTDLMIMQGATDITKERAIERRNEIFEIYTQLQKTPYVIITLGFIETWFDNQTQLFINRIPPRSFQASDPERFSFRILDVFESFSLLEPAMAALADHGSKVILTVSPVPIQATFSTSDCVIANEYSKSVLRVCAEMLCKRFANIDYFPSYEIARSGGLANYIHDNLHVKKEVVEKITTLMVEHYSK